MLIFEIVCAILLLWYVCGIINIAVMQITGGDNEFVYNRSTTLVFCYGMGPMLTVLCVLYYIGRLPIKIGTRYGRRLGRFIHDADV